MSLKRSEGNRSPSPAARKDAKLVAVPLSAEQNKVCQFVTSGAGHGVITARAGCGKTFILVEALKRIPAEHKVCQHIWLGMISHHCRCAGSRSCVQQKYKRGFPDRCGRKGGALSLDSKYCRLHAQWIWIRTISQRWREVCSPKGWTAIVCIAVCTCARRQG